MSFRFIYKFFLFKRKKKWWVQVANKNLYMFIALLLLLLFFAFVFWKGNDMVDPPLWTACRHNFVSESISIGSIFLKQIDVTSLSFFILSLFFFLTFFSKVSCNSFRAKLALSFGNTSIFFKVLILHLIFHEYFKIFFEYVLYLLVFWMKINVV